MVRDSRFLLRHFGREFMKITPLATLSYLFRATLISWSWNSTLSLEMPKSLWSVSTLKSVSARDCALATKTKNVRSSWLLRGHWSFKRFGSDLRDTSSFTVCRRVRTSLRKAFQACLTPLGGTWSSKTAWFQSNRKQQAKRARWHLRRLQTNARR